MQDELTSKVITSLHVVLTSGESASMAGKGTKSLEVLELYLDAYRARAKGSFCLAELKRRISCG